MDCESIYDSPGLKGNDTVSAPLPPRPQSHAIHPSWHGQWRCRPALRIPQHVCGEPVLPMRINDQHMVLQFQDSIGIIHAIHRPFAERHRWLFRLLQSRRGNRSPWRPDTSPPQTDQTGVGYVSHMQIGMQRGLIRHRNISVLTTVRLIVSVSRHAPSYVARKRTSGSSSSHGTSPSVRRSESITYRTRSSVNRLLIQRPPAHPCEPVGWRDRQLPAMREPGPEPRKADRNPAAERLPRFDAPCARASTPHPAVLPGPAQQMRPVIADYRAAAIVDKRAQIDIVVHRSPTSIARTMLFTP